MMSDFVTQRQDTSEPNDTAAECFASAYYTVAWQSLAYIERQNAIWPIRWQLSKQISPGLKPA